MHLILYIAKAQKDSLSCNPILNIPTTALTTTTTQHLIKEIQEDQLSDTVVKQIHQGLSVSPKDKPTGNSWTQPTFKRYLQIWHQLSNVDGIVCHTYKPGSS